MKIFLDANILFSAADHRSATRKLLLATCRYANCITSHHTHEEAYRNLVLKRPDKVSGLDELRKYFVLSEAYHNPAITTLPDNDIPVLAGAIGSKCSFLWTSDKRHFGKWYGKNIHGVIVISSMMLADMLIEMGWSP